MPTYSFVCSECGKKFDQMLTITKRNNAECPKCKAACGEKERDWAQSTTSIFISEKHKAVSSGKKYDTHPLDGGVPFGNVPGDDVHTEGRGVDDPFTPKP